jgi:hypothetical protein
MEISGVLAQLIIRSILCRWVPDEAISAIRVCEQFFRKMFEAGTQE